MSRIAVLGGGASGLSAAYYLSRFPGLDISKLLLIEGSPRLGGWVHSTRYDDGTIFEHGPRSMRVVGKAGLNSLELVEQLGLEGDMLPVSRSHPAVKNRYLYAKGQLCQLPNSVSSVFKKQAPFTSPLALQSWREPFKRSVPLHDETIYDFFTRRFSRELAEYIADPLCRGIYAGDCRTLSVKSCFPDVFRLEQETGSLIRGMITKPKSKDPPPVSGLAGRQAREKWSMWSMRQGLSQLTDAMTSALRADPRVKVITGSPVSKVTLQPGKVTMSYGDEEVEVDHIISSILAKRLAGLVDTEHQLLAAQLSQIPAVTVGVVNLEYEGATVPVQGFGHLIPSSEDSDVLGVLYDSDIFTEHNRTDKKALRLTVMMGGAWFEQYFGHPDAVDLDYLRDVAVRNIATQLGITQAPTRSVVSLQRDCISQYIVGHSDVLAAADTYITDHHLPLRLVGASYRGASVNDCIYNARLEAEGLAREIVGQRT